MIDFLNDIMEAITKKHIIIGSIILAFIISCIVAIVMLCNSTKDISSTVKVERAVKSEVYTVEIESSAEVSAESIYQKLASNNSEIKLLSMESDKEPRIVSLSSDTVIDSSLEICFADGNYKKNFTNAGEYDETLIIHNQVDQSMSSLSVKLMVTESDTAITTVAEVKTSKKVQSSRRSSHTIVSTTVKTTAVSVSTNAANYYEADNEYDYYDDYNEYEDYYEDDEEYDYYDNSGEYVEIGNEQPDNNTYNNPSNEDDNSEPNVTEPDTEAPSESSFETAEDFGWTGAEADLFNYAISKGCNVWQASAYVCACANYGEENIFIGLTPAGSTCWGVWYYDESTDTYHAA